MNPGLAETLAARRAARGTSLLLPDADHSRPTAGLPAKLPQHRDEAWKHTDPAELYRPAMSLASATATRPAIEDALEGETRVVFVDGRFAPGLSRIDAQDGGEAAVLVRAWSEGGHAVSQRPREGLAALNLALSSDGLVHRVQKGALRYLRVVCVTTPEAANSATHLHHEITVDGDTQVVFEHHGPDGCDYEAHHSLVLRIHGAGSRVTLLRWQQEGDAARSHFIADIEVAGRNCAVALAQYDIGARLARADIDLAIVDQSCRADTGFAALPGSGRRHDTRLTITHAAPRAVSATQFRALVEDRALAAFDGLIHILPGASGTVADMRLASLPLSRRAEVYAKPQLQIENDDVKCSHGATFGQLDDQALFYLRSRGVSPEAARNLLLRNFVGDAAQPIRDAGLREYIRRRLLGHLPGGELAEDVTSADEVAEAAE